ncbi:MAG: hypothetical protein JWQ71_4762 [Pedosphaera sp.]|nr:hypothetical protein [Pedosphaera sp.]
MIPIAPIAGGRLLAAVGSPVPQHDLWPYLLPPALLIIFGLLWQLTKQRKESRRLSEQIDQLTQRRKVILDFLHDLGEAFTEGIGLDELLYMIANFSVTTTQASAGAVFLLDKEKKNLQAEVIIGAFPPPLRPSEPIQSKINDHSQPLEQVVKSQIIPLGEGIIGEVAHSGKPVLIQDGLKDPRLVQYNDPLLQTRTAIFIPLKFKDEVLGVMAVVNKQTGNAAAYFDANDLFLLDSLADHAAISLYHATLYTLEAEQKQLDSDLRVASEIQRMLLPDHAPVVKNFDMVGYNIPARHVGGDYYDFLPLDESRVGVVIADVSGKAIPSALIMTICRSAIRAQTRLSSTPAETLQHVHELVIPDLREDMFITVLFGILDTTERTFNFVRAGHDPVLWYHATTGTVEVVAPKGMAVGLDRSHRLDQSLEERRLKLSPGDILVLYTDGITEGLDEMQQEFGRTQLIETIKANARENATEIIQAIFQQLRQFTDDTPPQDDRTLIVIKAL